MVSGAMLANLAVTPTIVITEHEAELFTRLLASDRRIEELESERNRLLEEKAGMPGRIEPGGGEARDQADSGPAAAARADLDRVSGVHAGVPRLRGGDEGDIPPVGQGAGVVRA